MRPSAAAWVSKAFNRSGHDDGGGDPVKIDKEIDQADDGKHHPAVGVAIGFVR